MLDTHTASSARSQAPSSRSKKKYADETRAQQQKHRDIADKYRRRRRGTRGGPKINVRICELDRLFTHRYGGEVLAYDDAGADDVKTMLHHLAHRPEPEQRMREWLRRRAPWYTEGGTDWIIAKVMRKPLKWTAAKLGRLLRLTNAERELLNITTFRPIDVSIVKRRATKDAERHGELRLKAGAKPHAMSDAQLKPWVKEDCSESTWRRRKRRCQDAGDRNSSAPYTKYIKLQTKHGHGVEVVIPTSDMSCPTGAPQARAVSGLSEAASVFATEARYQQPPVLAAAREAVTCMSSC